MASFQTFGFTPAYECNTRPDMPSDGREEVLFFSECLRRPTSSGELISVKPHDGEWWIGLFEFGDYGFFSAVCALPNPHHICVISGSRAYLVDVIKPSNWSMVDLYPVTSVSAAPDQRKFFLADFNSLCCVGINGVEWNSDDLFSDELSVAWTNDERCRLTGCNFGNQNSWVEVSLDSGSIIATGIAGQDQI